MMATAQERPATFSIPSDPSPSPDTPPESRVSVLLSLSDEMEERVEDLTRRTGYDRGELFNMSIALFKVCLDSVEQGHRVGVVDADREMSLDLTGFHKYHPPGEPIQEAS
jgi:hypothetical protein